MEIKQHSGVGRRSLVQWEAMRQALARTVAWQGRLRTTNVPPAEAVLLRFACQRRLSSTMELIDVKSRVLRAEAESGTVVII